MEKKYCLCEDCKKELVRGDKEAIVNFKSRKYCNQRCAIRARKYSPHPWSFPNGGGKNGKA